MSTETFITIAAIGVASRILCGLMNFSPLSFVLLSGIIATAIAAIELRGGL
jgi:hypothetical protein